MLCISFRICSNTSSNVSKHQSQHLLSPLYFGAPQRYSGKTNVDYTVKYYVCRLKNTAQVNMGVPFYGRYWRNVGEAVDASDPMWRIAKPKNGKFVGGFVPWHNISG